MAQSVGAAHTKSIRQGATCVDAAEHLKHRRGNTCSTHHKWQASKQASLRAGALFRVLLVMAVSAFGWTTAAGCSSESSSGPSNDHSAPPDASAEFASCVENAPCVFPRNPLLQGGG